MRLISPETEAAWRSEVKAGPTRPVARATIQHQWLRKTSYDTADAPGGDYSHERQRKGHFTNIMFGTRHVQEIRNLRKVSWSRSLDEDIASATLTVLNSEIVPMGSLPDTEGDDFDAPGNFTYNRGDESVTASPWGYDSQTGWAHLLAPDRVVKTYEGYGGNPDLPPGDDPDLYISGTWLIDVVSYDANGDLLIECRDLARLLVDQIAFPPIVPWEEYPMEWSTIRTDTVQGRAPQGGEWTFPAAEATSSNDLYVNADGSPKIEDKPKYVGKNGSVQGHMNRDPIQGDDNNFWLSTGQDSPDRHVYWEEEFDSPQNIAALRIKTVGGPYKIFISLANADGWIGKRKVPYKPADAFEGIELGANVRFVHSEIAEDSERYDVVLNRVYSNITRLRITMTRLRRFPGEKYPWRAGLRKVRVYTGSGLSFAHGEIQKAVGNYSDYTDIVKWVAAWCGWWWPEREDDNWIKFDGDGAKIHYDYATGDAVLPRGRVWGTFQKTGTAGVADLTADDFDKQPMLDCISKIRDITGFLFYIDESGGVVWRMPNLYEEGNYVTRDHKQNRRGPQRTTDHVVITDTETLLAYKTSLDSRNMRERVFVGDVMGDVGVTVSGYNPYPTGMRRVAGWTDQNWANRKECRVAADMIVARQMFDFRRGQSTIWGNPAIQVDDQIRYYERVTNETFFHYVLGIESELDNDAGTWTYQVTSHWLGERLQDAWVMDPNVLQAETRQYLNNLGDVD